MKYQIGKRSKLHRDWIVIILLYAMIFFMVTTGYFALCNWINSGKAQRCTVQL